MSVRVVHLVEDLPRGGMENLVANIVRGQRDAGHEVAVVCLRAEGQVADELRRDGFPVTLAGMSRARPANLVALRRILRASRPDVAHLHGMGAATFGRLSLLGTGTGTLFHVHTQLSVAHAGLLSLARRERLLARLPGVILAISDSVRRDLVDELGLPLRRIDVLSGGVPDVATAADRGAARARFGLAADDFAVVSVAALREHKGQEVLVRAIGGVPGARLLLAGEGPDEARLRTVVDDLDLAASVRFLGHVTDIPELLAAADVVALASFPREGLSLSIIEGLRAARPAVVTKVGGLPEVVEDQHNGYVVAANDPPAFAAALQSLKDDAGRRATMGARGRARFLERYELGHYLAELDKLYP